MNKTPDIIVFQADNVRVNGPKKDDSYSITFETGVYEAENISKLFLIPRESNLQISIKQI